MVGRNDPCPCGSGEKYKKCWSEFRSWLFACKQMTKTSSSRNDVHAQKRKQLCNLMGRRLASAIKLMTTKARNPYKAAGAGRKIVFQSAAYMSSSARSGVTNIAGTSVRKKMPMRKKTTASPLTGAASNSGIKAHTPLPVSKRMEKKARITNLNPFFRGFIMVPPIASYFEKRKGSTQEHQSTESHKRSMDKSLWIEA